ncbi:MAG: hypothetical protein E6Q44_07530 [Flavobacteriales bacterium]|jgi:hypothetical protein|nr:MAG: hypothetical protein E6Q44_07530 [Flavobacteriales bacterium]
MGTSNYERNVLPTGVVEFVVHPADLPTASGGPAGFVIKLIPFGAWLFRLIHEMAYEKPMEKIRSSGGRFSVDGNGIRQGDGVMIPKDRIHRLVIKNSVTDDPRYIGTHGRGMQEHARMTDLNRAAAVSYTLVAEAAGQGYTLAGGMTETTAYGLMQDVRAALGQ